MLAEILQNVKVFVPHRQQPGNDNTSTFKTVQLKIGYQLIVGMGTNTENGIEIFSITIRIYLIICFVRSCLCRLGRSFLCLGTGRIRILVQYTINLRSVSLVSGFYKLFKIRLLIYV